MLQGAIGPWRRRIGGRGAVGGFFAQESIETDLDSLEQDAVASAFVILSTQHIDRDLYF